MKVKAQFYVLALLGAAFSILLSACSFTKAPKKAWTEASCPIPPDYSQLENWAAHPDKADFADKTPIESFKDGQKDAAIDIFFLHPTTLFGQKEWNGDVTDEKLNGRTERTTIKHQASIFNGAGRIYAPRYRQMVLGAFFDKDDRVSNAKAFHTAYYDLKASFEYYMAHLNQGRPVMIVAHSQGSAHAIHLLKDYFDGQPLQSQLVAAYIAGWPVPADTFQVLKPCENPGETGCYATWCSFEWGTAPKHPQWYDRAVVVNPITWRTDTLPSEMSMHKGTVMGSYDRTFPEALKTQVHGGYLWVSRPKVKGTSIIRSNNFHIADYNLFWVDVRENAILRTQSYLEQQKGH
jgi:pimeloyl-ACP methyl ester carboxylesterase